MPERIYVTGPIRFAKPARAVADAARSLTRFDDVRQVVCDAVQRRACTVAELTEELRAGPAQGSTLFREALAEIDDGVRSVAEADARLLILRSDLPRPMFNARLYDADGVFIATVDAWWPEAGVAAEVDSRAYHLGAEDQDRTTERHDRLIAHGIFPLHFPPKRIRTDGPGVISDIRVGDREGTGPAAAADHRAPRRLSLVGPAQGSARGWASAGTRAAFRAPSEPIDPLRPIRADSNIQDKLFDTRLIFCHTLSMGCPISSR